ncbi:MAG: agmatinase [Candidatus Omnitrophota bacterium]
MEEYMRFAGPDGASTEQDKSKIAVLPVPYDKTSTWIKGADKGPLAILEASSFLEVYDIETDSEVHKKGIYTCAPLEIDSPPEEMIARVEREVLKLVDEGKFVVTLGGEHSVSIAPVKAHKRKFNDLCVLQLDAHADLRDEYEESRYNHACIAARIKEVCPIVQVGTRSMCLEEKGKVEAENVFFAKDIVTSDVWVEGVISRLSPNVYVTIDLDVFDPAIMPSTGTPEPGGLLWYQVTNLLKAVAERKKVVGFDVMELCPNPANKAPDFTAAKLVYKFLSYIF